MMRLGQKNRYKQSYYRSQRLGGTEVGFNKGSMTRAYNKRQKQCNSSDTNPGWAVQIDGEGGWDKRGQWACGFCPALDLRMLAHPVLLLAK